MAYFVGLDSGGTKTECWLGDEREVLARAVCPTVKLTRVSQEVATQRLRGLLAEVSLASGVRLGAVARTCVGAAGLSIAEVRKWVTRVVGELVGGELLVCGDDEIALDSAFRGGPGILVIGGTGSAVLGRCADGRRFKAGGWGPGIGDEGSGFWIGREAVRRAFLAMDGGVETGLLEAVRRTWGVEDLSGMVAYANRLPGPEYAVLAPVVMECAEAGDAVASEVLRTAGDELAGQVGVVWGKMCVYGERVGKVAYTGSVVEKIERVRLQMERRIVQRCAGLSVMSGAVNSMEGAMWRARGGTGAPRPEG